MGILEAIGGVMFADTMIFVGAFLLALVLTAWTRRLALRQGVLDHPNERSSHSQPTPRGGGLAIVISSSLSIIVLTAGHQVDFGLASALIFGGLLIATIGYFDDRRSLPAGIRIIAHATSAAWALYALGGLPPMQFGSHLVYLGIWGDLVGFVAIVWVLNLFNFMDGIDGIAASEAVFVAGAGGVLAIVFEHDSATGCAAFAIAVPALAFLCWNWPPAKIFMGDVGSGYLGYAIVVVAIAAGRSSPVAMLLWLTLGGVFFADATTTLLARWLHGERLYSPHRDHAYQRLALRWQGHRRVTVMVCAVNLLVLLPAVVLGFIRQQFAAAILASAILCLSAAVLRIRAG